MTRTLTISVPTSKGTKEVKAHWIGKTLAITEPLGHDSTIDGPNRGLWIVTHKECGLSAASLQTTKKAAVTLARKWDERFASIDAADARAWQHREEWNRTVRAINAPWQTAAAAAAAAPADDGSGTDTAMLLAAEAGIPVQCEPVAKIQWRGKFWPAPADAELDAWTFDSVAETPDGRTVEPDAPDSWLRILRLV